MRSAPESKTSPGGFVPPLVVTIISPDGRCRSAKIEIIEAAGAVMQ